MRAWDSLGLQGAQAQAAEARGRDVSVMAGAGSGKTRTLVGRYLSLLDEDLPSRGIAAVTFTDKAAREMRNRIRERVQAWVRGDRPEAERVKWEDIEADIDAARIGTIHALCAALLRAHPAEAGVDPEFDVLDEADAAVLKAHAVEVALGAAVDDETFAPLFRVYETNALVEVLGKLLKSRLEVEVALARPDVADEWNRAIVARVRGFAEDGAVAELIGELREQASSGALDADAGDKLAPQVRGLLGEWGEMEYALGQGGGAQAARALFRIRREYLKVGGKRGQAQEGIKELQGLYDSMVDPWLGGEASRDPAPDLSVEETYAGLIAPLTELFRRAAEAYRHAKDARQALDFDDLEADAVRLMADAEIRARWQSQIRALLVDEFQDTNDRQRRIVEALAGTEDGPTGRLFVVGDAKQSIYGFRGADVTVFRDLDRRIRARGGLPLALDRTYRAHASFVEALNELLACAMGTTDDPARPFAIPFVRLSAEREAADDAIRAPFIEFLYGLGEDAEESRPVGAELLARRLSELNAEGVRWDSIALLFRASTGFPAYEAALEARGIPFATVAGRGFHDRPEVRDLLNLLRAVADPWDDLAVAGALRSPAFGLSDASIYMLRWPNGDEPAPLWEALAGPMPGLAPDECERAARARETLKRLAGWAGRVPVAELLGRTLDETHYLAALASDATGGRLRRNVEKLLADAHAIGATSVPEFLAAIEVVKDVGAREGEAPAEAGGAVRLMTVHKAKGLEFPVVVIADASRAPRGSGGETFVLPELGVVPWSGTGSEKPLIYRIAQAEAAEREAAEDLRVLYVAATRAKEKLIVCGHAMKGVAKTWMGKLAAAAGLDLDALAAHPGEWREQRLPASGEMIGAMASAEGASLAASVAALEVERDSPSVTVAPLYLPLPVAAREAPSRPMEPRRARRWERRHDGTLVGVLVHEALRHWRFPGDAGLGSVLRATALAQGAAESGETEVAMARATELLARLRADARCADIGAAERRHEVPFSTVIDGRITAGFIDLLYRDADGGWGIVDFKTDALADEAGMRQAIESDYEEQMRRYRRAAETHLGQSAAGALCFLDYGGSVRWESLTFPD